MNLPNKLTIFRIVMVIPFLVLLSFNYLSIWYGLGAATIFILASITDFLDGYIARKKGIITNFGKLMDPLADKILVISALIYFVELQYIPGWMVIVIVAREFLVTGIRTIASAKGDVIPAGVLGKYKTASQMIIIPLVILLKDSTFSFLLMIIPVVLTVWSGYDYVKNAKHYFE